MENNKSSSSSSSLHGIGKRRQIPDLEFVILSKYYFHPRLKFLFCHSCQDLKIFIYLLIPDASTSFDTSQKFHFRSLSLTVWLFTNLLKLNTTGQHRNRHKFVKFNFSLDVRCFEN